METIAQGDGGRQAQHCGLEGRRGARQNDAHFFLGGPAACHLPSASSGISSLADFPSPLRGSRGWRGSLMDQMVHVRTVAIDIHTAEGANTKPAIWVEVRVVAQGLRMLWRVERAWCTLLRGGSGRRAPALHGRPQQRQRRQTPRRRVHRAQKFLAAARRW